MKKRVIVTGIIVLLLGICGWGIWTTFFQEPEQEIMVAAMTRGDIEETVVATGILKPTKLVAVGAQVSGRIESLNVRIGQKVHMGDLVATIDSTKQTKDLRVSEANLAMARADLVERQAALAKAKADFEREKTTFAKNASSKAALDAAELTVIAATAQLDYITAQIKEREVAVDTANVNLGYTQIRAPMDGTVLAEVVQPGQTVNSVQSAPTIVIIGDIETMTVRAEISEADIVRVKPGQEVYFTIMGDRVRRYTARLESIEPAPESIKTDSAVVSSSTTSATQGAIYYIGVFSVPNDDSSLRTYMTAQVSIVLGKVEKVLTIPASVLGRQGRDGSYTVEVQEAKGVIASRKVTIGLNNRVNAEVLSGLNEGDKVVTGRVEPGSRNTAGGGRPMGMGMGGGGRR